MTKTEDSGAFSRVALDMTIQSQVLTMHTLACLLYILQCMREKHPSARKSPKIQKVKDFTYSRITSDCFCHHRPGWYVCTCENIAYLKTVEKVSVPYKVYNSLVEY